MVQTDILGALKSAVSRGNSLQQAMQTLVNSGYSISEINEAASYLQTNSQPKQNTQQQTTKSIKNENQPVQKPKQIQKVSSYEQPKKKQSVGKKIFLVILIMTLIFLLGLLISTLLFREQLAEIFLEVFG